MTERKGFVHLYVGDGKGKTTAAVGLALRALSYGHRVLFSQFLKGRESGEIAGLERLGCGILRAKSTEKFVFQMSEEERMELRRSHIEALGEIRARICAGEFDMVALDESVDAVNCGILPLDELLGLIRERPAGVELVLTGRNPPSELVELCDYHTEFICKAHPYQKGVSARKGIEY